MEEKESNKLFLILGEIKGELKSFTSAFVNMDNRINRLENDISAYYEKCDFRIRTLEKMRWKVLGICLALPVIVSVVPFFFKG